MKGQSASQGSLVSALTQYTQAH